MRWPSSTSALSRMVVLAWEMSWPASRSSLAEKAAEKAAAAKAAAQQRGVDGRLAVLTVHKMAASGDAIAANALASSPCDD